MMDTEKAVVEHYTRGDTKLTMLAEIRRIAANPEHLTIDDLGAYDEFHIGGRRATEHFMPQMKLKPGMKVLDIGCGVGGAARYAASKYNVSVTGIDLTPEFVDTAQALSEATGLCEKTSFVVGSALSLPFADQEFDAAFTIHACMNIKDKSGVYREVARVLKSGSLFGIYDILGGAEAGTPNFPLPWSTFPESSFLATREAVGTFLNEAGFEILHAENRRDFALATFEKAKSDNKPDIRGSDFPKKRENLAAAVRSGLCGPWEFICRKR